MSFLSGSKNNHQKDLLSILDQVKHSEDDGQDEFNFDSNKLHLNFDEDPENQSVPTIEESKPKLKSKARQVGKSNIIPPRNKYEHAIKDDDNQDYEGEGDKNFDFKNVTKSDNEEFFQIPLNDSPVHKNTGSLKMTIVTNYQLEHDKRYAQKNEEEINWKDISDVKYDEDEILPKNLKHEKGQKTKKNNKKDSKDPSVPSILKNMMDEEIGEVINFILPALKIY